MCMADDQPVEDLQNLTGAELVGVGEPIGQHQTLLLGFEEDDGTEHSVEAYVFQVSEHDDGDEMSMDDPEVQRALENLREEDIQQLPDEVQEKLRSALD